MRLIDADAADVERICCYYGDNCRIEDVQEWLDDQYTVDAAPVVHARWEYNPGDNIPYCSNCAMPQDVPTNYCHGCGAKMDGKEDENEAD